MDCQKKLQADNDHSNGQFSVGYIVENESGKTAFMKASDISLLFGDDDSENRAGRMLVGLQAHVFERNVLEYCHGNSMDRIIVAIDHGDFLANYNGIQQPLFFLIFELAECDLRHTIIDDGTVDDIWRLSALHHLSIAVQQLHTGGICHNDIKPANFLVINQDLQKLGDLGHATSDAHVAQHADRHDVGDPTYACPEILYATTTIECGKLCQSDARRASDLYQLGSLAYYLFSGRAITPDVVARMAIAHRPSTEDSGWGGTFAEVMPYWRIAFNDLMFEFDETMKMGRSSSQIELLTQLSTAIRQLSDPDPLLRGHPLERSGSQDKRSVRRYISLFDQMMQRLAVAA